MIYYTLQNKNASQVKGVMLNISLSLSSMWLDWIPEMVTYFDVPSTLTRRMITFPGILGALP